jgi:hypothetical protein
MISSPDYSPMVSHRSNDGTEVEEEIDFEEEEQSTSNQSTIRQPPSIRSNDSQQPIYGNRSAQQHDDDIDIEIEHDESRVDDEDVIYTPPSESDQYSS